MKGEVRGGSVSVWGRMEQAMRVTDLLLQAWRVRRDCAGHGEPGAGAGVADSAGDLVSVCGGGGAEPDERGVADAAWVLEE